MNLEIVPKVLASSTIGKSPRTDRVKWKLSAESFVPIIWIVCKILALFYILRDDTKQKDIKLSQFRNLFLNRKGCLGLK